MPCKRVGGVGFAEGGRGSGGGWTTGGWGSKLGLRVGGSGGGEGNAKAQDPAGIPDGM